ncbi:uncharacterized protein LOC123713195 [Pieris brassicae]|uniref:uncharacterized protein LOC123713195 n=1 Tax=Pieris brassicae TaxID=7116 RepID=UPI001E6600AC|nr:uncharacterized protein LOC123713195 [Pieris brassicae]
MSSESSTLDERKMSSSMRFIPFGSLLKTWTEVSRINYMSTMAIDEIMSRDQRFKSFSLPLKKISVPVFDPSKFQNKDEESELIEQFPLNVTTLMNEDKLWGCFYNFPELYDEMYSPLVRVRHIDDIPDIEGGVLTRDLVCGCLSYLKRSPILGDYVCIKLDLSSNFLTNIDVLKHYKYLVYLDLSSNILEDLSVLSFLPYIQFLNVSFNNFKSVLDYETPQWFLTEVQYRYNYVMKIRDLQAFWSITVIDLSHNNIKAITGLETLRYLRRLDLSFNHIQKIENLNHLRLTWMDLSYNNISDFEFDDNSGLWTLLHLEYLNINENSLTSMKLFSGCTRLREIHARNNRLSSLLELAVYMNKLRRLTLLDFRSNPICSVPGYKDVVINTFPLLLCLDDIELDPIEQRTRKMNMNPNVITFASRRLLRLLYIEQLSRSRVSPYNPPADTTDVPLIVLVGYEAVGKGSLARRIAAECSSHVELSMMHTTAFYHFSEHYKQVTRKQFDDMLLDGQFLTYSEMDGESYGLSRAEAFVRDGKVRVVTMDLLGALMLKLRGWQPYLILMTCSDKRSLAARQLERKMARDLATDDIISTNMMEISTLQVLLSGRIIINGIINEILQAIPEGKSQSEFIIESECSLLMESEPRHARKYNKNVNRLTVLTPSSSTIGDACKSEQDKNSIMGSSMYSLYKESQPIDEYTSDVYGTQSAERGHPKTRPKKQTNRPKSFENIRYHRNWKAGSRKSSKSVAFMSPENTEESDPSGLFVEPVAQKEMENVLLTKSISASVGRSHGENDSQASDLWLAFLAENGLAQASEIFSEAHNAKKRESRLDEGDFFKIQLDNYKEIPIETFTTTLKDDYDEINRTCPGLFWNTVNTDNSEVAFAKTKRIIKEIVNSQNQLKPLFDIDFSNLTNYPNMEEKLTAISRQIAPQRLFY